MTTQHSFRRSIALGTAIASLLLACSGLAAQTLARPGWIGSGMTAQTWFRHAVIYEIDVRRFQDSNGDGIGDLKGVAERLEYIRSLGVDAILLAPLGPPGTAPQTANQSGGGGGQPEVIDPALGTLDDFDDLTLQASRMKVRVLLDLPDPDPALARFWLTRGVAGFHIPERNSAGQANAAAIQVVRKLLPGYVGQRVLITDAEMPAATGSLANGGKAGNELVLDTALLKLPVAGPAASGQAAAGQGAGAAGLSAAGQVRAALEAAQTVRVPAGLLLETDAPGVPRSVIRFAGGGAAGESRAEATGLGRIGAAILMLNRAGVVLSAGQELALVPVVDAAMPWGAPPAPMAGQSPDAGSVSDSEGQRPAAAKAPVPRRPAVSDVYVPYVPPAPAAKAAAAPPPDPASAAGEELDPRSPLNFYRQLNRLRHGGSALRDGDEIFLDFDALNALVWIRRPASPSYANPPVVILCNFSDKPAAIALKPELARLHLRGSFLKTVLRSDGGMGAMDISPVHLPPYGVYVGELKF